MQNKVFITVLIIVSSLASSVAIAANRSMKEMKGNCDNFEMDLSRELTKFQEAGKILVGEKKPSPTAKAISSLEKKLLVSLHPKDQVSFIKKPRKEFYKGEKTYGASLSFKVPESGVYRLSGGSRFWFSVVDMNQKETVKEKDFEMQMACKSIFKVVSFPLMKDTTYKLQISSSKHKQVAIMLSKESI